MKKSRVWVTRQVPQVGLDLLSSACDVEVWPGELPPSRDEILQRVTGCDGLLTLLSDRIDADVISAAGPQLKVISNFAVGYNNIDLQAAADRNISVGNTPGVLTDATADIAVGLMLAAARRFQESIDQVKNLKWQTWEPLGLMGQELSGKTLGIIGLGRIGQAVAKRCCGGWDMSLLYTARSDKKDLPESWRARRVDLETLLRESDFVSIHCDLNSDTKHMINARTLSLMKPTAVLVNTARGGVIDQDALYQSLKARTLFAAGLDVTDPEPLPEDSCLRMLNNCLILPHIGSATVEARNQMAIIAANNIISGLAGKPLPYAVPLPESKSQP